MEQLLRPLPTRLSSSLCRQNGHNAIQRLHQHRLRKLSPPSSLTHLSTARRKYTTEQHGERFSNHGKQHQQYERQRSALSFRNPLNYQDVANYSKTRGKSTNRRLKLYGVGLVLCLALQYLITSRSSTSSDKDAALSIRNLLPTDRADAPPGTVVGEFQGKKVVEKPGMPEIKVDENGRQLIETGHSVVPFFPREIDLPGVSDADEYQLLGLGVRTVSFLSISVYVVGLYVRTADLPNLQAAFVKQYNQLGTSLIPSEKENLKQDLLNGEKGLELWDKVLREAGVQSAVRIVPVRNTDFAHLRDGFVRGITQRTQEKAREGSKDYDDDAFGQAVQDFKGLFGGRGKAPKGSILIMLRDRDGALAVQYQSGEKKQAEQLGALKDERIARQLWLGYLGGKTVSSEPARKSIVDGVLDLVERPVGAVGKQVL